MKAEIKKGWLQNPGDFQWQIWTSDLQWSMSDVMSWEDIQKEWDRKYSNTVAELNLEIICVIDGKESEYIEGTFYKVHIGSADGAEVQIF